ncbi:hypothetical protein KFL_005740050 [Klebsormidium nitens]|uniref:NmrA-like domain-containing protein n=1 Tax=Klebsormidium nitens TaxID=105231 RepID=A0A1Y1IGB9_KLENI|nr:hypothetical protein KFL_005740050 [Klebsormidium nitens]|eukprot:GAQ89894.1 hypothetical protein KFL_005740050 [Klebsormidium nitens]
MAHMNAGLESSGAPESLEGAKTPPLVAIIPATSQVGRATIESLLAHHPDKVRIRAAARSLSQSDELRSFQNLEIIEGVDAFLRETHEAAFRGVERCFIVAPKLENRVEAVNLLMGSAQRCGVKHVVLIGGVFQEDEVCVMHQHWQATKRHAQVLGLKWTQLQCVDFMENVLQHKITIASESRMYGTGRGGRSPAVAVHDIGAAAASVLACDDDRHFDRSYRIVGPAAIGPDNMAAAFSNVLGRQVQFVDYGLEKWRQDALSLKKMPEWQVRGFYDWLRLYFLTGKLADVKSDLPLLGVQPTRFEDWLRARSSLFEGADETAAVARQKELVLS